MTVPIPTVSACFGTRFIECQVTVRTNATHKEVDAASCFDGLLVSLTLSLEVGRIAIQDMDVLLLDVDVAEEILPHEAVVRLRMFLWKVDILVHVESNNILERKFASLILLNQFVVQSQRRRTCRTAQYERLSWSRF